METLTGIPGSLGAAVYGNAGAYGHSIMERVEPVRFFDGEASGLRQRRVRVPLPRERLQAAQGMDHLSAMLHSTHAPAAELRKTADDILKMRNEKYPPDMKCAGSIFKNLIC